MANNSPTVYIKNACKNFGKIGILSNLSMGVPKGVIYGLLGSSGCGKTTLLTCILGLRRIDSGQLWVLGGNPSEKGCGILGRRVGYMPQETSLMGEFTIQDTIFFFGRIYDLEESTIRERYNNLSSLLDLPPGDHFVRNCSGGQKRRLSFAISIVHHPDLIILDEPTVGVDSLLRERIWKYLVEITNTTKTSVILTTHYIEEARQANLVGLMRDGRLLVERPPEYLMDKFGADSLEDVFLTLSKKQDDNQLDLQLEAIENDTFNNLPVVLTDFDGDNTEGVHFHRRIFRALMEKNAKQFYRNMGGSVLVVLLPLIQVVIFLLVLGSDIKNINLAIINDDVLLSCQNVTLNDSAVATDTANCHFRNLGCRFLKQIDIPMIKKVDYKSVYEAQEAVKHGKIVGVIHIPHNYSSSFEKILHVTDRTPKPHLLEKSRIHVWLDMSNSQIGGTIKLKLLQNFQIYHKKLMTDCGINPKIATVVDFENMYGRDDVPYTVFMTPGMILNMIFFVATMMTSQIISFDICDGVWERMTIAGVSTLEIIITHLIFQASVIVFHTIEAFVTVFWYFQINFVGNIWILALLTYLQGLVGMIVGFWISASSRNISLSFLSVTGIFFTLTVVSGLLWPLEGMPILMSWFSKLLPTTIPIDSFRNVMQKGWPLTHPQVLSGLGTELLYIIIFVILSHFAIKKQR